MRIVDIRETTVSIRSQLRNAFISFSEMTVSAVAILTDVVRDGRRLAGYGFHSNGRYAQAGILRERMIPRLLQAPEAALDPFEARQILMRNEKPGGHGERSVAAGTLDMALWDLAAKIEGKPLYRLLGERFGGGSADPTVWVYAAGGYYYPGKDVAALEDEIRGYLNLGYETVKIKIGGAIGGNQPVARLLPANNRIVSPGLGEDRPAFRPRTPPDSRLRRSKGKAIPPLADHFESSSKTLRRSAFASMPMPG